MYYLDIKIKYKIFFLGFLVWFIWDFYCKNDVKTLTYFTIFFFFRYICLNNLMLLVFDYANPNILKIKIIF